MNVIGFGHVLQGAADEANRFRQHQLQQEQLMLHRNADTRAQELWGLQKGEHARLEGERNRAKEVNDKYAAMRASLERGDFANVVPQVLNEFNNPQTGYPAQGLNAGVYKAGNGAYVGALSNEQGQLVKQIPLTQYTMDLAIEQARLRELSRISDEHSKQYLTFLQKRHEGAIQQQQWERDYDLRNRTSENNDKYQRGMLDIAQLRESRLLDEDLLKQATPEEQDALAQLMHAYGNAKTPEERAWIQQHLGMLGSAIAIRGGTVPSALFNNDRAKAPSFSDIQRASEYVDSYIADATQLAQDAGDKNALKLYQDLSFKDRNAIIRYVAQHPDTDIGSLVQNRMSLLPEAKSAYGNKPTPDKNRARYENLLNSITGAPPVRPSDANGGRGWDVAAEPTPMQRGVTGQVIEPRAPIDWRTWLNNIDAARGRRPGER